MLRKRAQASNPMSDLHTPLLVESETDGNSSADHRHQKNDGQASPSAQLPPAYPPKSISWWRKLLQKLTQLRDNLLDYIYWNIWRRFFPSPEPSLLLASNLESLQQRIAIPYDAQLIDHQQYLRRLWVAVFPLDPFPEGIKSPQWKVMGWQGIDPGSDFRGGGFFALELLVYFAENQPREFEALMKKERGTRSEWEYPFSAAGVNLTYMLVGKTSLSIASGFDFWMFSIYFYCSILLPCFLLCAVFIVKYSTSSCF